MDLREVHFNDLQLIVSEIHSILRWQVRFLFTHLVFVAFVWIMCGEYSGIHELRIGDFTLQALYEKKLFELILLLPYTSNATVNKYLTLSFNSIYNSCALFHNNNSVLTNFIFLLFYDDCIYWTSILTHRFSYALLVDINRSYVEI